MIDSKTFPHFDVVYRVIERMRGGEGLESWMSGNWGSHWYIGLRAIMESRPNPVEAENYLSHLLFLSESDDRHASQVLENIFQKSMNFKENNEKHPTDND